MGFIAEGLWQIKIGDYRSAARLFQDHLSDIDLKSTSKISLMAWIGECYSNCEDCAEAGKWFELAGTTIKNCAKFSDTDRRKRSKQLFELALEAYRSANDIEGIRRASRLMYSSSATVMRSKIDS